MDAADQFILEQSIHYRINSTHDNPHCLAFRLEPFGELVVTRNQGVRCMHANLGYRGPQHLLEPRCKLTPYGMPVMGDGREGFC